MVEKVFSCKECGDPYLAPTPDDLYSIASIEEVRGSIRREYKCKNGHKNVIFWR